MNLLVYTLVLHKLVYQRLFHMKLYYEQLNTIEKYTLLQYTYIKIVLFFNQNNQRPLISNVQHENSKLSNIQKNKLLIYY